MRRNVCLFAHFDRDHKVADHVIRYVQAISDLGFEIVFISASAPSEQELGPLRDVCSDIILRENSGHDFGSWNEGYCRHRAQLTGELLLVNDSVYGPVGNLGEGLERLRGLDADMSGFVESRAILPHLQSWLLLVQPEAHKSGTFQRILRFDYSNRPKTEIVLEGEIGLSTAMRAAGFKVAGLFSDVGFVLSKFPFNPSLLLWRELIEDERCPFLKVELLRDNPCNISWLETWREVVAKRAPDLPQMIEAHLSRITGRPISSCVQIGPRKRLHYANWYRQAYHLRSAAYPLRKTNALAFDALEWAYYLMPKHVRDTARSSLS